MINRFILIIVAIGSLNCNMRQDSNSNMTTAINLSTDWEFIDGESGRPFNIYADIDIIYRDSFIMYRDRTHFMEFKSGMTYQRNDTVYNTGRPFEDSTKISYTFFVYKDGDAKGYRYDSLNSIDGLLFNVDSLLKAKTFKGMGFYNDNDSLVETVNHPEGYKKLKKYIPKTKYDESYGDSSYLYFSGKLIGTKYSFSPLLDSTEKMKLCKVIFVYNPIPKGSQYKIDLPRRQMSFEIKEIEIDHSEKVGALFERFKKNIPGK